MMSKWPVKTIEECARSEPYSTQIGPFGKALMADQYTVSGVPVLRGVNVNYGRFHDDDFVFIDEDTANRLRKFESFPGDVLLVHKGTLGQIGLMPRNRKFPRYIMGNSMMRVRCDRSKLLPEYLYYWLSSAEGQQYLFSRISQVGVPQIQTPLKTLRQAALPVPPIAEQEKIAHILGALDDKIELNHRMNETLEAMAQAIFKSWFIDFDGHTDFVDSELGPIPGGWEVVRLVQVADVSWGDTSTTKKSYTPKGFLAYSASGPDGFLPYYDFDRTGIILSAIGANSGTSWLAHGQWSCIKNTIRFWSIESHLPTEYLFYATKGRDFWPKRGSAQPFISQADARNVRLILPDSATATAFGDIASRLYVKRQAALEESTTLAELRDALLPKLLSGELSVRDAERAAGAVV